MKRENIRGGVGLRRALPLALLLGLFWAALPTCARAQQPRQWGEFGVSGMGFSLDRELLAWPGFALNLGSWHKTWAIEGYALFFLYAPVAGGASIIASPFRATKIVPYISLGGFYAGEFLCVGPGILLNAGLGLKFPLSDRWGIRVEGRLMFYQEYASKWETGGALAAGIYLAFGRKAGARR